MTPLPFRISRKRSRTAAPMTWCSTELVSEWVWPQWPRGTRYACVFLFLFMSVSVSVSISLMPDLPSRISSLLYCSPSYFTAFCPDSLDYSTSDFRFHPCRQFRAMSVSVIYQLQGVGSILTTNHCRAPSFHS